VIAGARLGYGITRVYVFFYLARKGGRETNKIIRESGQVAMV
jgi:hypothetical protein